MLMIWHWVAQKKIIASFGRLCKSMFNLKARLNCQKYSAGIMHCAIVGLLFTLRISQSNVSNCRSTCPARKSSTSALLTVMEELWSTLTINVLDSCQHQLQSWSWNSCGLDESAVQTSWLPSIHSPETSRWSSNDDKRAARLVGYIAATVDFAQVMRIKDPPAKLWLSLYVDIDFGSSPDMKSTSGFILALEGPGRPKVNDGGWVCYTTCCIVW